jgi:filamentous hemagglutinin family protein
MNLKILTAIIGCGLFAAGPLSAAVTPDGTLASAVTRNGIRYDISAGTQVGGNLFHSFSQFNLTSGEIASFSGPTGIANIISRVTGGASSIDGTIRSTISGANLFLVNPAGIMFGPNAALDVTGSFHATTADYLRLGSNGGVFYADPGNPALKLTVDPPSAFGFLKQSPADISMNGSYLAVPQGKDISIVAGNIDLTNTNIWSYGGAVNLVSLAAGGEVPYSNGIFQTQDFSTLGKITVVENRPFQPQVYKGTDTGAAGMDGFSVANLDASSDVGGGRIFIRGGSIFISGSSIFNDAYGKLPQGATDLAARGNITLSDTSVTGTATALGSASGAPITISGASINITANSIVNTDSFSGANGSDITVRGTESVTIDGLSHVSTDSNGSGLAGNITISAPNVSILSTQNREQTNNNATTVSSSAPAIGVKGAGTILIEAEKLLSLSGSLQSTTVDGQSGAISIRSGALDLFGQGTISTRLVVPRNAFGGTAGNIDITCGAITLRNNGRIDSAVDSSTSGIGGSISVRADNVSMYDQSSISASISTAVGSGGNITISAADTILIASKATNFSSNVRSIGSIASDTSAGDAGHISLSARNITVTNGAIVSTYGIPGSTGSAGNIAVAASNQFTIDNGALNTQSASASGGNIIVDSPGIMNVLNGSLTASATAGKGNGGNVTIGAGFLTLNRGVVTAQAEFGNGGNLLINVKEKFVRSFDSILSASSRYGQQGTVVVNSPNTDVTGALAAPAVDIVNLNAFIPKRCVTPDELNASTFRLLGSSGLPALPEQSFPTF